MLLRDSGVYVLARVVPAALGFVSSLLLTWVLPPDAYGNYALYFSIMVLGSTLLFDWLSHSLLRWYHGDDRSPELMATVFATFLGICVLSVLILLAIMPTGLMAGYHAQAWLVLLGICAYAWFDLNANLQMVQFRPKRFLVISVCRNGLILLATPLSASMTGFPLFALMATVIATLLAGSCYIFDPGSRPGRSVDPALIRAFFVFGWPIGLTTGFSSLMNVANRLILAWFVGDAAVGYFSAGTVLMQNSIGVLAAGIGAAAYPFALRAMAHGTEGELRAQLGSNFSLLMALLLPAGVGIALIMPKLTPLLLRPAYQAPVDMLAPWLAASAVLAGIRANYIDHAFQLGRRTSLLAVVGISCGLVNLALDFLLIPRWGVVGAAAALTGALAMSVVLAWGLAQRACKLPIPLSELVRIVLATMVMAFAIELMAPFPGPLQLATQIGLTAALYFSMAITLNIHSLRDLTLQAIFLRFQRG